ncbi:hypothetical protein Tcan_18616 [Toxocara canis]|uniref:C-type lectin domain-containing protein n=1 Tax=Toxocara canis TaxID=6265 RepID=A0A0B2V1Q4_TOXCA|nr:hypothetical protein Tcan_18616 [Toxocara canis]
MTAGVELGNNNKNCPTTTAMGMALVTTLTTFRAHAFQPSVAQAGASTPTHTSRPDQNQEEPFERRKGGQRACPPNWTPFNTHCYIASLPGRFLFNQASDWCTQTGSRVVWFDQSTVANFGSELNFINCE